MKIISIDSGISGAVACVSETGGSVMDMPTIKRGKQKIIDTDTLRGICHDMWGDYSAIIIEAPQWRRGNSAKGNATAFFNHGRVTAAFEEWAEVHAGVWKHDMGLSKDLRRR